MSKRKKATLVNYKFESIRLNGGRFIKICDDMMKAMAWQKLSIRQRGLYLELKRQFVSRSDGSTTELEIYILHSQFKNNYKSKNTLFDDVDQLIENGFIKVVQHGKYARQPNIYGFTDEWKMYNTPEFFIHPNNKRLTNKNSYNEK